VLLWKVAITGKV